MKKLIFSTILLFLSISCKTNINSFSITDVDSTISWVMPLAKEEFILWGGDPPGCGVLIFKDAPEFTYSESKK